MTLTEVQIECDSTLQRLESLFVPGCRLTLLMRSPGVDDGDLLFTKDDIDDVIKAIARLKDREPTGLKPNE